MDQRTNLGSFIADLFAAEGVESVIEQFSFLGSAFVLTRDGVVVAANQHATNLVGLHKRDLYGQRVVDLISDDERPDMTARLSNNDTTPYELKIVTGTGELRDALVTPSYFIAEGETYRLAQLTDITQEKRDRVLRDQVNRMIEHSAAVLFIWNNTQHWSVEFVSANVSRFGYAPEDFSSGKLGFNTLIAPEERQRVCEGIESASQAGADEWQQEYSLLTADGSLRWVNTRTSIRRDGNGTVTRYESIVLDNTQARLKQLEVARYQRMVAGARDMLALVSEDYRYIAVNHSYADAYAMTEEQMTSLTVLEVLGDRYFYDVIKPRLDQCLAGERVSFQEWRTLPGQGERFLDVCYSLSREAGLAVVVAARDITALQTTHLALQSSEARWAASFNVTAMPSCIVDLSAGTTLDVNDKFVNLFGYSREMLTGGNFLQKSLTLNPEEFTRLVEVLRKSGTVSDYPILTRSKGGKVLSLLVSACRMNADDDAKFLIAFLDTSELRLEEQKLFDSLVQTVHAIARMVEHRDPYTGGHMGRVAELAVAIAQRLRLPSIRIEGLRFAAEIHDVGKIYVPAEILTRPGTPSAAEMEIIKTHAQVGYEIVKDIDFPWPIADAVHQHHERLDGSGYPQGLQGQEICEEAQILAVADTVEAMSSHRPYRPALPIDAALRVIQKDRGTKLNPEAVDACLALFREGFVFSSHF